MNESNYPEGVERFNPPWNDDVETLPLGTLPDEDNRVDE